MQLFYTPNITPPHYTLDESESRHAIKVLRLAQGATIWLTDGRGTMYKGQIVEPNPKRCLVQVVESVEQFERRDYRLTMAVAPTKSIDRFEWFLEKATEVGCDGFIPIESFHAERRMLNIERSNRVITSAVKQSLKAYHPTLEPITPLKNIISTPFKGVKLIAHCDLNFVRKPMQELVSKGDDVLILIGPEGDFSGEEIALAHKNGFIGVSLGQSRLRTETAALCAVINIAFINQSE